MRFERYGGTGRSVSDSGWRIEAEPEDAILMRPGQPFLGTLGDVGLQGTLRPYAYPHQSREWRQRAMRYLVRAREELERRGDVVTPRRLASEREEARRGSFVLELDTGQVARFNSYRSENPNERGTRLYRPGASDFAEEVLGEGGATHADLFRAGDERPRIYQGSLSSVEYLPFNSWTRTPNGSVHHGQQPPVIARAYGLKAAAMNLVDDRVMGEEAVDPGAIAAAWEVAMDAFIEAGLPLQETFARENADYWWRRAKVSSRRAAVRLRKRR